MAVHDAMGGESKKAKSAIPINATSRMSRSRMQLKEPLDMSNERYLMELKSRQLTAEGIDYLADNIVSHDLYCTYLSIGVCTDCFY